MPPGLSTISVSRRDNINGLIFSTNPALPTAGFRSREISCRLSKWRDGKQVGRIRGRFGAFNSFYTEVVF